MYLYSWWWEYISACYLYGHFIGLNGQYILSENFALSSGMLISPWRFSCIPFKKSIPVFYKLFRNIYGMQIFSVWPCLDQWAKENITFIAATTSTCWLIQLRKRPEYPIHKPDSYSLVGISVCLLVIWLLCFSAYVPSLPLLLYSLSQLDVHLIHPS